MKKVMCVLLILCIFPVCAFASDLDDVLFDFNIYAEILGAQKLEGTPDISDKGTFTMITYKISEDIYAGFYEQNGKITSGFVACYGSENEGDFLALSAAHLWHFCGVADGMDAYMLLLSDFFDARQGKETDPAPVGNVLISTGSIKNGGLSFICTMID